MPSIQPPSSPTTATERANSAQLQTLQIFTSLKLQIISIATALYGTNSPNPMSAFDIITYTCPPLPLAPSTLTPSSHNAKYLPPHSTSTPSLHNAKDLPPHSPSSPSTSSTTTSTTTTTAVEHHHHDLAPTPPPPPPSHGVALITYTSAPSTLTTWEILSRIEGQTSVNEGMRKLLGDLEGGMGRVIANLTAKRTYAVTHARVPDLVGAEGGTVPLAGLAGENGFEEEERCGRDGGGGDEVGGLPAWTSTGDLDRETAQDRGGGGGDGEWKEEKVMEKPRLTVIVEEVE
ncbi:hypothetical protein CC80DRAFT_593463 [Byssothecium circinans]|uniref:Uncharacterized protein n=1 Tax=Byssothecium circinans TaxID=147558 RepID=A0A6A5TWE4_9PLEO|nr:hypothetical protein CC80DRAFT_593463 [Byssothecium circinans]